MAILTLTTNDFITRAQKIHGTTYDYTKSVYTGRPKKLIIICKTHGEFQQRAGHHLQGQGCLQCGIQRMTEFQNMWSETDVKFLTENYSLKGAKFCARMLKKRLNTVYHKARELKLRKNSKPLNHPYVPGRIWSNLLCSSKNRGLVLEITPDDVYEKFITQQRKCALTGMDLVLSRNVKLNTASVDRINSSENYTKNNIQLVHKKINHCKMDLTDKEFFNICKMVYFNLKDKIIAL